MSDLPRAHKITALILITLVVVVTLIAVAVSGGSGDSTAEAGPVTDPNATPTAVPIVHRERVQWSTIADTVRGAQGTQSPVPCPFIDERVREPNNFLSLTPGLTFVCAQEGLAATPIAPGRIVMRSNQPPLNSVKADLIANGNDGPWIRASAYGPFVAIDHGTFNGVNNVTTIYAGLDSIEPDLALGQLVDTSTALGQLGARVINEERINGVLTFELITDGTRFGQDPMRQAPPPPSESVQLAAAVADSFELPLTTCSLPFGNLDLGVGAPREYRSGIHNGLDFNCGTTEHQIRPSSAGQVLFVMNDYADATPDDRNAVLAMAETAIDTPFWTLAMLYGNFVVVDHELGGGRRAVTIYAHMTDVDPGIVPGRQVGIDTVLGRVGNSGTSTAAGGVFDTHSSVHLHWELHVNDRPIGYLEAPAATEPLYRQILCGTPEAAALPGCVVEP